MFIIYGIAHKTKYYKKFCQIIHCNICGANSFFKFFKTYTAFTLFFIPTFRWNTHYYLETACCGTVFEVDKKIARALARGKEIEILPEHVRQINHLGTYTPTY